MIKEKRFPGNPMTYVYGVTYLSTATASGQNVRYQSPEKAVLAVEPLYRGVVKLTSKDAFNDIVVCKRKRGTNLTAIQKKHNT